jgi:chromosome segregation ATPase
MLLALFYIAAYRRGIRDVKDDCQAERKMETNRREVDTRRHGIISGLIRNLNINIDTVRQDNQQSVEALATDIKSRIDIEHQANKYSVQALASDIESTKTVLQAKMGRVQAEITKLEQTKDKLVRDIRSAQSIRDRYKNEVDELQAKF